MQIVEKIKEHPYLSALVVFVIGFALVLLFRSGSSGAGSSAGVPPDYGSMVGNGTAIQQAQMAADAHAADTQAALSAQESTNATNLAIAQLAQTVQLNGQNAQADTINKQTAAGVKVAQFQYDSTNFANQLVAQVQTHTLDVNAATTLADLGYKHDIDVQQIASQNLTTTLNAQVQEATLATSLQQTQLVANAYSTAAKYASDATIANINASTANTAALVNAQNYQVAVQAETQREQMAYQAQLTAQAQGAAWIAAHT